jgi:hypothetical protein
MWPNNITSEKVADIIRDIRRSSARFLLAIPPMVELAAFQKLIPLTRHGTSNSISNEDSWLVHARNPGFLG